jgi:hypothetical protein
MFKNVAATAGIICFFSITASTFPAESGNGIITTQLGKTVNSLRAELSRKNITQKEAKAAWTQLAKLLQLSGETISAAAAWTAAATAETASRDDAAMLEAALCYISAGEIEKAEALIKLVLVTTRDNKSNFTKASFLTAQIEAIRSGNISILTELTKDDNYRPLLPAIYWSLIKLNGGKEYERRLISEFPSSPESKALESEHGEINFVYETPSPLWILPPDKKLATLEPVKAQSKESRPAANDISPPLQTGIFTRKENALLQAVRLKKSGFTAEVSRKTAAGAEYWAVTVPGGASQQRTIIALKDAGFDAFPVYEEY